MVEVENLVKTFPKVKAVDTISFSIRTEICFGMLGPNGAGKTTTMEIMEGICAPTGGTILYKNKPRDRRFKEEVGIQFQTTALQEKLTCREVIEMFARMYTKSLSVAYLSELCGLDEFIDRDSHKISGGQRQRLLLAVALVNDPELIFLDEPTTGLDPQARQNFWKVVRLIKDQRKTIILSTHYMEEAYALCDELIIMDHGKIISQGNPHELLDKYFKETALRLPGGNANFDKIPGSLKPHRHGDTIELHITNINETLAQLIQAEVDLQRLEIHKPTLEDLFLHVTGAGAKGERMVVK
ncbi:MAG: ATP-binding cassette domain-containing protein [Chitinivibrionales bacterium]|nr:ATP-binding cassette domain-containing protein [Chitinivibrionales bacterium]